MHQTFSPALVGVLLSLSLAGHARAQLSDATAQMAPRRASAVAGRVTSSGAPIAGAHVAVRERGSAVERSTTSGAGGRFVLADLPVGEYALSIRAIGYRERVVSAVLTEGRTETMDMALERAPVMLDATVTTATRTASSLSEIPGAVTVVDREAVQAQGATAAGLGEALAKTVPGLGGAAQRIQLSFNHYDARQDTRWATVPSRDTTGKARTRSGLELETPQGSLHTVGSIDYSHAAAPLLLPVLRGSRVHAQIFHRDFVTRFGPSLRKLKRPSTGTTTPQSYVYQSYLDTWKTGGRLEVTTRLLDAVRASVTCGGDASRERTFQGISIFDKPVYDSSQGLRFVKTDDWMWVPPMRTRSLAAFAQLEVHPISPLTVRGGVRHERDRVDVDDFTTIEEVSVAGGSLSFAPTVYNAGAVLAAGRGVELFANFSQGFSLGDIGLVLRQAPAGFVLGAKSTRAQEVDQYEAGMRGLWSRVQATASAFRSRSELGSQVDGNLRVVRAPERIHGVETTLDVQPASRVDVGGTFTWSEGEFLDPKDSSWKALNGFRISPAKTTAYVAARPLSRLTTRFQMVHSGNRDAAFLDRISNGGRRVHEYTTFDLLGTLGVGSGGTLSVGVENLLNRQYLTTVAQLMTTNTDACRAAARGRVLSVGYRVEY